MQKPWRALACLCLAVAAVIGPSRPAAAVTRRVLVGGLDGRTCTAYFHTDGDVLRWPVMLSLRGTGVYTTAGDARLDASERALVERGLVTVLTLDKPGISPAAERVMVDDTQYNEYTQDDLVHCSREALRWAFSQPDATGPRAYALLSGHSEGSQVALRLLAGLESQGDALAARVKGLFLSGLPMVAWRDLLAAQLSDGDRKTFFTAFQHRDDAVLRTFGNLSYTYLASVFAQEPLRQTLDQLTELGTHARFFIYQGLYDHHTAPGPVMDFVQRNRLRASHRQKALSLRARFYPAGHGLNSQALSDIRSDVAALVHAFAQTSDQTGEASH